MKHFDSTFSRNFLINIGKRHFKKKCFGKIFYVFSISGLKKSNSVKEFTSAANIPGTESLNEQHFRKRASHGFIFFYF